MFRPLTDSATHADRFDTQPLVDYSLNVFLFLIKLLVQVVIYYNKEGHGYLFPTFFLKILLVYF